MKDHSNSANTTYEDIITVLNVKDKISLPAFARQLLLNQIQAPDLTEQIMLINAAQELRDSAPHQPLSGLQLSTPTEDKTMNKLDHAVQLLNDREYRIAEVIFTNGTYDPVSERDLDKPKVYRYKIPLEMDVRKGDILLVCVSGTTSASYEDVNEPHDGNYTYKMVKCVNVLPHDEVLFIDDKFLKWVVSKVDVRNYQQDVCHEGSLYNILETQQRRGDALDRAHELCKEFGSKKFLGSEDECTDRDWETSC